MIDPAKPRSYLLARYEIARIVGAARARLIAAGRCRAGR